jgi:hypothetical protein
MIPRACPARDDLRTALAGGRYLGFLARAR